LKMATPIVQPQVLTQSPTVTKMKIAVPPLPAMATVLAVTMETPIVQPQVLTQSPTVTKMKIAVPPLPAMATVLALKMATPTPAVEWVGCWTPKHCCPCRQRTAEAQVTRPPAEQVSV
jgi:hypothetical protein